MSCKNNLTLLSYEMKIFQSNMNSNPWCLLIQTLSSFLSISFNYFLSKSTFLGGKISLRMKLLVKWWWQLGDNNIVSKFPLKYKVNFPKWYLLARQLLQRRMVFHKIEAHFPFKGHVDILLLFQTWWMRIEEL